MDKRLLGAGLLGALLVLGASGIAASAAEPTQTINACVSNRMGFVRIINQGQTCLADLETPTSWNQTGPQGAPGQQGAPGAPGAPGEAGPPGPAGATGWQCVDAHGLDAPPGAIAYAAVRCPDGKKLTGGGYGQDSNGDITIHSIVQANHVLYEVYGRNHGSETKKLYVWAICLNSTD